MKNFTDIILETPFRSFVKTVRIQDYLANELTYGKAVGCYGEKMAESMLKS